MPKTILSKSYLLFGLLFLSNSANAAFYSGNDLVSYYQSYKAFKANNKDVDYVNVNGYAMFIAGVHDSLDDTLFCTPENVTTGQINSVVGKYLDENPELWASAASLLVIKALQKAFPCK